MRSPTRPRRTAAARKPWRAAAWAALWLAVLLAHLALLGALGASTGAALRGSARVAPAEAPQRLSLSMWRVTVATLVPASPAPPPLQAAPLAARAAPVPPAARPAAPTAAVVAPSAAPAVWPADTGSEAASPAVDAEAPVYATRLPDPVRLQYRLQRGGQSGSARLQWQVDAAGYALRLDADWPGRPAQGSASRGLIDADGVAPLRHAELRRAREVRAVNFQRDAAQITFSGPQAVYALPAGAQDRLSWMIQLPAILQADPGLARTGATVTLFVAGTRGDAEAWRFEVQGRESLQLPAGPAPDVLRLSREPRRPYDTRVEVWLDPARQHLPVQARFTTLPAGEALELRLAAVETGP
jgi:hypothetical protein